MDENAFDHARLKLARGRFHIAELEKEIETYLSTEPYVSILSERRAGGQLQVSLTKITREILPVKTVAILGDAVHNIRVALDVSANALVALSGYIPKGVYFPFGNDEAGFEAAMKDKMKGASAEVKEMVRALKPYRGGNEALRALHDLDIIDKHSAPLNQDTQMTGPEMKVQGIGTPAGVSFDYSAANLRPLDQSTLPSPFEQQEGFTVLGVTDAEHQIVLAKSLPLAGEPVIKALNDFAGLVDGIIQSFETHFFGDKG